MSIGAEILAPAGSPDAVRAAVRCGANAVYLGGKAFNARRSAANFTDDELLEAVQYCHARAVKVYMTLNTLVGDGEIKSAYKAVECACNVNADALILQDIGLVRAVREIAPDMPMHASTQMSVQSIDGVRRLEQMGFCRVVLPRELSYEEIRLIAESSDMELELFVHGALCMSVSGQCLMSAVIGSRSGNRGLCAQPCRLPFGLKKGDGHFLSLKDLSLVSELPELACAGIASFKIEGRMKRPEYVAAAVTACRESLCGALSPEISESLRAVFSRSGFTKGYFEGRIDTDMFGIRRKEDVTDASPVLASLRRLYDKERSDIPVAFDIKCVADRPVSLVARAGEKAVEVCSDTVPSPAVSRPATVESLTAQLSKCGSTQFCCGSVKADIGQGLNVPASAVNALRREALSQLDTALAERPPKRFIPCEQSANSRHTAAAEPALYARFFSPRQLEDCDLGKVRRVIVPLSTPADTVADIVSHGIEVAAEIPRAFFSNGNKYLKQLLTLKQAGVCLAYAGTLDGIELAARAAMPCGAFFGSNIYNTSAILELEANGVCEALLSCEMTAGQLSSLGGGIPRGIFAYGRLPLMLTRSCPIKNGLNCGTCPGKSVLVDRMGEQFPVICSNSCSEVLNSRVLYLADRLGEFHGIDYALLYFTTESPQECSRMIENYSAGARPQGEFTRGLYFRGVE